MFLAFLDSLLNVERTYHAIFGRADGQVNHRDFALDRLQILPASDAREAVIAKRVGFVWIATVMTGLDHINQWQEFGQRACRSGLGGAAFAAHQHPTDLRVDGVEDQRQFHFVLADDSREREDRYHPTRPFKY